MDYILLLIGFVLLVKGADIFVEGSSAIAKHFKIPAFIIGLTIVAMGTSAPEAAVSITAAIGGQNGIVAGNVLGSNLFNTLAVLGICALIKPCPVAPKIVKGEYPMSGLVTVLFIILALTTLGGPEQLYFSRIDGIILLAAFTAFLIFTVKKAFSEDHHDEEEIKDISMVKSVIMVILGIAGIIIGGNFVVNSASAIAASFGISETLIGLTIVAIGTSLPELVTSVAAALKGHTDIAVGNVIGSNIFNLLFVMGLSTTIHPVSIEMLSIYDAAILTVVTMVTLIPCIRHKHITRLWGAIMTALYVIYMVYIIVR
jgi:cation:H+ antiporter